MRKKNTGRKKPRAADPRTRLLLAALPNVAFDGWTEDLIGRAAKKAHLGQSAAQKLFPAGCVDLVSFFSAWADAETRAVLEKEDLESLRVRDRIALGVKTRLEVLMPWKEAVAASLKFMTLPPRSLRMPGLVWATADELWDLAGDTATDYNRYTKRILLSGVLTSTTLYWLNDTSPGHKKTAIFLENRIADVLKIGQCLSAFRPEARAKG